MNCRAIARLMQWRVLAQRTQLLGYIDRQFTNTWLIESENWPSLLQFSRTMKNRCHTWRWKWFSWGSPRVHRWVDCQTGILQWGKRSPWLSSQCFLATGLLVELNKCFGNLNCSTKLTPKHPKTLFYRGGIWEKRRVHQYRWNQVFFTSVKLSKSINVLIVIENHWSLA